MHKVVLCLDPVYGMVALGVQPALPVDGVQVILGNELIGGHFWAGTQSSLVVTHTTSVKKAEIEDKVHPQIFQHVLLQGLRLV